MENLFAKNFPGLFTILTNSDYMLTEMTRNCRKFVYCSWAIRVNHSAGHLCSVAILNPFQESYLLCRANNLFERAETYHHKVASPKQQSNEASIYITLHIICINFQVVSFTDNFRECATLNTFYEEIFKLHIFFIESG